MCMCKEKEEEEKKKNNSVYHSDPWNLLSELGLPVNFVAQRHLKESELGD